MGIDILGGLTGGLKGSLNATSPSDFLGAAGNISTTGFATNLLGGAASGAAMRGLLGMDTTPCPSGSRKGGNNGAGSGNDPCGRNDNSLKAAILGLGMAAAGPSIAQAGATLGGMMDTGMGALSNTIGSAMGSATASIASSTGLNPSIVGSSLGAGVSAVAGGASGSGSTIAALTGATSATSAINSSTSTSSSYASGASSASSFLASAKSKVSSFF